MMSEQEAITETRMEWKMIRVPKALHDQLAREAQKRGLPIHAIISEALNFYYGFTKSRVPRKEHSNIDKGLWYIMKLAMSVGALKADPSFDNLRRLSKTLAQLRERLDIDTSELEEFIRVHSIFIDDEVKMELNAITKNLIYQIADKLLFRVE